MPRCPACNHRLYAAQDLATGARGLLCHHCGWRSAVNARQDWVRYFARQMAQYVEEQR